MKRLKKGYASILALMMAIVMTTVFMVPDLGISVKAGGLEILGSSYFNGDPPKILVHYMDPRTDTASVEVFVVNKDSSGSINTVTIRGETYYVKLIRMVDMSKDVVENADGSKSLELYETKVFGTKPAAGTTAKLYMRTWDSNYNITGETSVDITIPPENTSTGDGAEQKTATPPTGKDFTYDGTEHTGVEAGTGYTLSGTAKAVDAGSYKATATLASGYKWTDGSTAPKEISWTINQAENTMTVKAKKVTCKFKNKKKKVTYKADQVYDIQNAKGDVRFQKVEIKRGNKQLSKKDYKKIAVSQTTGKITIKKGLPKGKYKVKVTITASGNNNYIAKSRDVTVKITVK